MKKIIYLIVLIAPLCYGYSFKKLFKEVEKSFHQDHKTTSHKVNKGQIQIPNEPFTKAEAPQSVSYGESFGRCDVFFPKKRAPAIDSRLTSKSRSICSTKFAVLYSTDYKSPIYTIEKLSYLNFVSKKVERSNKFKEDYRLKDSEKSTLDDYKEVSFQFDRGHNVPSGDFVGGSEFENEETFYLSNMSAQDATLNRGIWAKSVEKAVRSYVQRSSGDIYVFTGGYYGKNPVRFGKSKVAIPNYFWKLVYDDYTKKSWVYWIENNSTDKLKVLSYQEFVDKTQLKLLD